VPLTENDRDYLVTRTAMRIAERPDGMPDALDIAAPRRDAPCVCRVPGSPFLPALFVASAIAPLANTVWPQPLRSMLGLGSLAPGLPAYLLSQGEER